MITSLTINSILFYFYYTYSIINNNMRNLLFPFQDFPVKKFGMQDQPHTKLYILMKTILPMLPNSNLSMKIDEDRLRKVIVELWEQTISLVIDKSNESKDFTLVYDNELSVSSIKGGLKFQE